MFEKMEESSGNVIGFKVIGTINKADYESLIPEIENLVAKEGTINLLLDLTDFKWEKVSAWGADWKFGREYHEEIKKLAIVGDKKWEEWLAKLAEPFYAGEARFFHRQAIEEAWTWLRDQG